MDLWILPSSSCRAGRPGCTAHFNAAMRVRNFLLSPPFIMYYLTFALPQVADLLSDTGFSVMVADDLFPAPYGHLSLVIATKLYPRTHLNKNWRF